MARRGTLTGLQYLGGKSAAGPSGTGPWVSSLLPWEQRSLYCEPFGGMAGVLLQRAPVDVEIYNDLSGDLVNWWRCIRERTEAFHTAMQWTPHSRVEWRRCVQYLRAAPPLTDLDSPPDIERARCLTVLVLQSGNRGVNPDVLKEGHWYRTKATRKRGLKRYTMTELDALRQRMERVQFECQDAVKLLTELAAKDYAVIYCDPPYAGTQQPYTHDVDRAALADALRAQQGRCAISGYDTEWDALGWHRHERAIRLPSHLHDLPERLEVLWTNYRPLQLPLWSDVPNNGPALLDAARTGA